MEHNEYYKSQFTSDNCTAAKRACKEFINEYQPILSKLDAHLEALMKKTEPAYAQAYKPWLNGLRDICKGILLMSKGIPLPDPAALIDALKMFCFESTLQLLHDLCISCKLIVKADWIKKFRQDIDTMLFAVATLNNHQHAIPR